MRALLAVLVLIAPLSLAASASETFACNVDVGTGRVLVPAETVVNGATIGPCLLGFADEGYGDDWTVVRVAASPACAVVAPDGSFPAPEVSRNSELAPNTNLWGVCDALASGTFQVEISRTVGFP